MHIDPATSVRRLSLAACAVAVAASVGTTQGAECDGSALVKIEKYCSASWRNAGIDQQDWEDCTQDALSELFERMPQQHVAQAINDGESIQRRELNRAIWRIVQRWRRAPRAVSLDEHESLSLAASEVTPEAAEDSELVMSVAAECLSERQQRILGLWTDGWSIAEIAEQLELTPARASDEKYKAIRKLRQRLVTCA